MAIGKTAEDYFEADLYYCKGCGICAQECFTGCITMVPEEE
jgi:pyruvate ferredoxin oxidoreductase delta subunit